MAARTCVVTLNGDSTDDLDPDAGPLPGQPADWLQNLEGRRRYSLVVWAPPDGVPLAGADFDRDCEEYLQCAGTAQRLTVEMRRPTAAGAEQCVVGRGHEHRGEPDTPVPWQAVTTTVYPDEVFTADEALPPFVAYAQTGDLPAGTATRRLEL